MRGRNPSYGLRAGFLDRRIRALARQYSELVRLRDLVRKAEAIKKMRQRSASLAAKAKGARRIR